MLLSLPPKCVVARHIFFLTLVRSSMLLIHRWKGPSIFTLKLGMDIASLVA